MTASLAPQRVIDDLERQWATSPPAGRARLGNLVRSEITVLTVLAFAGYLASGWWVRFGLHFWINDALNRTDDALYVTIGRDPHLGAIGFYWPPLPQLIQIPIVPFLRPFGEEIMAGPISTAMCTAATIPVLAAIGRRLHCGRVLIFAVCLAFAFTPYVMYTASNGMSEACSFLVVAVSMLGFFGYIQTHSTRDMIILSLGLTGVAMTRPEGPAFVVAIVIVASFNPRDLRKSAWNGALIALPPLATYLFWLIVQYVLLKDALFFLHQNEAQTPPAPGQNVWLPSGIGGHLGVAILWALGWILVFGPAVLLCLLALFRSAPQSARGSLGLLAGMGSFVAVQLVSVTYQDGYGDPRYFCMAVVMGAISVLWLAPKARGALPLLFTGGLVASLVFSAGYTSYSLTSGRLTHIEDECTYFQFGVARALPFLGRTQSGKYACVAPPNSLSAWQSADSWIDAHLTSSDRVLADNASDYAAELFTTRPKLFVVRNDRDWQKIVANPVSVTYIMTQSTTPSGSPITGGVNQAEDEGAVLIGFDPAGWHLVKSFGGGYNVLHEDTYVQIWHFLPHPGAPTPTGTQTIIDEGR